MKLLKTRIFNPAVIMLFIIAAAGNAGTLWLRCGLYDFKDDAAKKFYKIGWSGRLTYDFFERRNFTAGLTRGVSYSTVPYNSEEHDMLIIPFLFSWKYYIPIEAVQFRPYFGSGIGVYGKMDYNELFKNNHYSFTYGYHLLSGFTAPISDRLNASVELNYNAVITSSTEDLNPSGFDILIGAGYSF